MAAPLGDATSNAPAKDTLSLALICHPAVSFETAVLGSVLLRNDSYFACTNEGLKQEHFMSGLHQRLWQALGTQILAGLEATPLTIGARFANDAEFEQAGGLKYFATLATAAASIVNPAAYVRGVREWASRARPISTR